MKTLQEMTAAELVADLEDATSLSMNECNNCGHQHRKIKSELFCNGCGTQFVIFKRRKLQTRCTSAPDRLKAGSITPLTAELDSRCEKAGIRRNPDGSFSIAAFDLPLKEAEERAALINYMISKP